MKDAQIKPLALNGQMDNMPNVDTLMTAIFGHK